MGGGPDSSGSPPAPLTVSSGAGSFLRQAGATGPERTALGSRHVTQDRQSQQALGPGAGPEGTAPPWHSSQAWVVRTWWSGVSSVLGAAWAGASGHRAQGSSFRSWSNASVNIHLLAGRPPSPGPSCPTSRPHKAGAASTVGRTLQAAGSDPSSHGFLPRTPTREAGDLSCS